MPIQPGVVVPLDRGQLRTLLGTSGRGFGPPPVGGSVDPAADDILFQLPIDAFPFGVGTSEKFGEDEERSVNSIFLLLKCSAGVVRDVDGHKSGEGRVVTGFVPSLLKRVVNKFYDEI